MKILILVPIYYRDELAYNCAMSLIKSTIIPNDSIVDISFGVNKCSDELKQQLINLTHQGTEKMRMHFTDFNENIGKPSVVNRLSHGYKFDYLVSLDGDMLCIQPDWLVNLTSIYEYCNKKNPGKLGALCGNQFGSCCHIINEKSLNAKTQSIGRFTLISGQYNEGIAGGVLMTDYPTWSAIGGYDATKLYGGDDGYYSHQCVLRNKSVAYVKEVGFYHPFELNKAYTEWKCSMLDEINNGPVVSDDIRKGFFE